MPDALVFVEPVKLDLPFVPAIRARRMDPEWELADDVVDLALLVVSLVDIQSANPRCVINGGVLIAIDFAAVFFYQGQKFHIYLYFTAGCPVTVLT